MVRLFNYSVLTAIEPLLGKNVIIYGRSLSALDEIIYLKSSGIIVEAITDTYVEKFEEYFAGI